MSPGGAPVADPLGHRGGKHPLWISGTDRRILDDMSKAAGAPVTPGMVFRHGLATMQDPVTAGPDLAPALDLVARLAAALARGGRVTYGGSAEPAGQGDAETLEAAAALLRKYFHPSRRNGQVPSEGLADQLTVAETLLEYAARQARGSTDDPPIALVRVADSDSVISSGSAGVVTPEQYGGQQEEP